MNRADIGWIPWQDSSAFAPLYPSGVRGSPKEE